MLNKLACLQCMVLHSSAEHCGANAEATGSNPVEAPKILLRNCLNCDLTAMVTYLFQGIMRQNTM